MIRTQFKHLGRVLREAEAATDLPVVGDIVEIDDVRFEVTARLYKVPDRAPASVTITLHYAAPLDVED